jgi:hypothetical protein
VIFLLIPSSAATSARGVWAEWRRKVDITSNIDPAEPARIIGPAPAAVERTTGIQQRTILLGQPATSPLIDRIGLVFEKANRARRQRLRAVSSFVDSRPRTTRETFTSGLRITL